MRRWLGLAVSFVVLSAAGCGGVVRVASKWVQNGDRQYGVTYYIGGAGPIGHVGSLSVPEGLEDAGYRGYVEVFPWQTVTTAIDQLDLERNRAKGSELAEQIRRQKRRNPDVPVNIIALSAGTGIATFALERLPEDIKVENAVYLSSSLSSHYDLTRALRRVRGGVYVFFSDEDPILNNLLPLAGTVDRKDADEGVAGLQGFRRPRRSRETNEQYMKVHNVRCKAEYAEYGYSGGHTGATSRSFVAHVIAPLVIRGDGMESRSARSEPAAEESSQSPAIAHASEQESR